MINIVNKQAASAEPLTLTKVISHYRAGCDVADVLPHDDNATGAEASGTWRGWWDILLAWDAPAASRAEAIDALQLAIEGEELCYSGLTTPMMKAALGWLQSAADSDSDPDSGPRLPAGPARDELEMNLHRISGFALVVDLLLSEFREFNDAERNAVVLQLEPLQGAIIAARGAFRKLCGRQA